MPKPLKYDWDDVSETTALFVPNHLVPKSYTGSLDSSFQCWCRRNGITGWRIVSRSIPNGKLFWIVDQDWSPNPNLYVSSVAATDATAGIETIDTIRGLDIPTIDHVKFREQPIDRMKVNEEMFIPGDKSSAVRKVFKRNRGAGYRYTCRACIQGYMIRRIK